MSSCQFVLFELLLAQYNFNNFCFCVSEVVKLIVKYIYLFFQLTFLDRQANKNSSIEELTQLT